MKMVIGAVLALLSGNSYALTDFKCVNDCTQSGYMYQLCVDRCSTQQQPTQQYRQLESAPPPSALPAPKRTDFQCMNTCTSAGYQYGFCKSKCEY